MSDIQELGGRIAVAMDRIRSGIEQMAQSPRTGSDSDSDQLQSMLSEERTANAQLEERVKTLKERQDTNMSAMESRLGEQADEIATLAEQIDSLRTANAELSAANEALQNAASGDNSGSADANGETLAELEALKAQRAADAAEVDAILSEIKPLVEGA